MKRDPDLSLQGKALPIHAAGKTRARDIYRFGANPHLRIRVQRTICRIPMEYRRFEVIAPKGAEQNAPFYGHVSGGTVNLAALGGQMQRFNVVWKELGPQFFHKG